MKEKDIERGFVNYVEADGKLAVKLNAFGVRGIPDRIVLPGNGYCFFIEFKRPGGKVGKVQKYMHKVLRRLGYGVWTIDNKEEAIQVYEDQKAQANS